MGSSQPAEVEQVKSKEDDVSLDKLKHNFPSLDS